VTAIWTRVDEIGTNPREVVVASRYPRADGGWARATDLSVPALDAGSLSLVVSPRCDATAVWSAWDGALWKVQGVRYPSGGSEWSAVVDVAVFGPDPQTPTPLPSTGPRDPRPDAVADDEGNIFVYWVVAREGWYVVVAPEGLQGVRFTAATNALSGPQWLSRLTDRDSVLSTRLVIDSAGRATVVWNMCMDNRCGGLSIQSTRWLPTPGAPSVTAASPGSGSLTIAFDAPTTIDPAFAPTNYEYSLDDGLTWTPRLPPSAVSPLHISGLTNGTPYNVRLRALNVAGPGAASAPTPVLPPDRPTGLTVLARSGHVVTINWTPPGGGLPPTSYVLEGGLQPGQVLASVPTDASPTLFTFEAPSGVFYLRIHAVAGGAWSAPSNEIRLVVDVPAPPSAPTNLLGLVNGSSVALSWINTYDGGTPVILGLRVTGAVNTILPLPFGDTFTLSGVPPGTYTLSVVAANANGISPPSNSVTLSFPGACSGVPDVPTNFQALKAGSTILVSWSPPASGPAVSSYTVQVSGAYVDSFTTTARMLSGVAGSGTYTLNVRATNACGTSTATPMQTVVIP
jgi:hypothetical protein